MTGFAERRRWRTLLLLAVLGLLGGFVATRLGRRAEPAAAAATQSPAPTRPPARGSSLSVVGGMTPAEAARLGIRLPDVQAPPALGLDSTPRAPAPIPEARIGVTGLEESGPPIVASFSADVQRAAVRYLCLCGCPHVLVDCPCRDQPIGAGTMLAYLEKQVRAGGSTQALDAAMVDRYGERVLAPGGR